jgi:hypothetical protein
MLSRQTLELAKGKTAIEVSAWNELIPTLVALGGGCWRIRYSDRRREQHTSFGVRQEVRLLTCIDATLVPKYLVKLNTEAERPAQGRPGATIASRMPAA